MSSTTGDRLFLAVPLDDRTRSAIKGRLSGGFPKSLNLRMVHPSSWHLTVRFLGQTPVDRATRIVAALDRLEKGTAFDVRFGRIGGYPRPKRARVVWLGVGARNDRLTHLAYIVNDALEGIGLAAARRPFKPHLTVARARKPVDVSPLVASCPSFDIPMVARSLVLYRSELLPSGARYTVRHRWSLQVSDAEADNSRFDTNQTTDRGEHDG